MPKTAKSEESDEHDPGWKKVIGCFFPSFMAFYFPTIFEIIDWEKEWVFLDKELEKIRKDQKISRKNADKLVRVVLKSCNEAWLLIHIEVQMNYQASFRKRVFVYNYRIFDQHNVEVISLVVLGDPRPSWRPTSFSYGHGGAQTRIDFLAVKLSDYQERWAELKASDNPFALVTMVHLRALQTRKQPEDRYIWKLSMMRSLVSKGWKRDDIAELLDFMDYVMTLPEGLDKKLVMELNNKEGEAKMAYINSWRKMGREEALEKVLREQISKKFGQVPGWVTKRLEKADETTLLGWAIALLEVNKLEDLFA